ncbi:COMM domain-containing protein 3 isoform X1 [Rhinoderma darwinii]|uniref:COMM domain-containing protein 3 isoform X1 n=1 Tax=Rhinoderma darwinii TaxID=43563 RepID=UPI003F672814
MELSEDSLRGLHRLADPAQFSVKAFSAVLRAAFQSLSPDQAAHPALDDTVFQHIPLCHIKECQAAATTCILEAVRNSVDRAALSTFLEDCKFDKERTEDFWTEYQKHRESLEILLENIGRAPPHVSDVSWRLAYEIKTNQLYKTYRPSYLVKFNLEAPDTIQTQNIGFNCSMEQLQDLVGKLKDAAKGLERTSQM